MTDLEAGFEEELLVPENESDEEEDADLSKRSDRVRRWSGVRALLIVVQGWVVVVCW